MTKSYLWSKILKDYDHKKNINDFRQPGNINSRLAHWNPRELSLRWFKSFLLLGASQLGPEQIESYRKLGKTNIGSPIEVTILDNQSNILNVNLDYLLSIHELTFLEENLPDFSTLQNICEVGAGFGRTCHALLANIKSLNTYTIVDLPEMLEISKQYLKLALDVNLFAKIEFIEAEEFKQLNRNYDLSIQIDGLQEMDSDVINNYFANIFGCSTYFFSVNPIGKFLPGNAGLENVDSSAVENVLGLGRSLSILDIWNLEEISKTRVTHIENYKPSQSKILNSESNKLFPHYELTLYKNLP